jgi:hypothetical protein
MHFFNLFISKLESCSRYKSLRQWSAAFCPCRMAAQNLMVECRPKNVVLMVWMKSTQSRRPTKNKFQHYREWPVWFLVIASVACKGARKKL